MVSIPFIAGQWSLRAGNRLPRARAVLVSIPFIAGQWSLPRAQERAKREIAAFQSPSLRGSGRFGMALLCLDEADKGFNPLHCGAVVASNVCRVSGLGVRYGFNPLHCGAVVASRWRRSPRSPRSPSFNPLHCGAVVASNPPRRALHFGSDVSIPFIAGQWSLRYSELLEKS